MAFTIHVNGKSNSLVHKGSLGIAKSTLPDVCKTPSPGGPVPIPYPVIVSMSSDLKKGTKTVKVEGKNMAAIKGSEFCRCTGDEPGTAGGVKSSTNMKEATWILYSFDVKLDGKNACRLSDKMMMNHGNTVCLSGESDTEVAAKTVATLCLHCGKPLSDPSHKELKTNDKKTMEQAALVGAGGQVKTSGAMKVGGETTTALAGAVKSKGKVKLFNLKTKKEIPLTDAMRDAVNKLHNNQLGQCAEEKLLINEFINKKPPTVFPPPGGVKMGIVSSNHGKPKKTDPVKYKKKCNKCEKILISMTCTNDAKEGGV